MLYLRVSGLFIFLLSVSFGCFPYWDFFLAAFTFKFLLSTLHSEGPMPGPI